MAVEEGGEIGGESPLIKLEGVEFCCKDLLDDILKWPLKKNADGLCREVAVGETTVGIHLASMSSLANCLESLLAELSLAR